MRNPARHVAQRLKLLRLAQRLLGLPLIGSVEQGRDGASVFGRVMKNLQRLPSLLALDERGLASLLDLGIERIVVMAEFVDFWVVAERPAFCRAAASPLAA